MNITQNQKELDRKLDEALLDALKGTPLVKDGEAVLDDDGKPIMVPPSAPMLQAIRSRLRDLNISRIPVDPADPVNKMAEALGLEPGQNPFRTFSIAHGRPAVIPEMDDDEDDAATTRAG